MDEKARQALIDGVLAGAQQATAQAFSDYRQQHEDMTQKHRTEERLIEIVLAAEEMLAMIGQLRPDAEA